MRQFILCFILSVATINVFPQLSSIKGNICDENGIKIEFAPVVLLLPKDSTIAYFGVSNGQGNFEIKAVKNGKYMLQAAFMGYQTVFREVTLPLAGGEDLGTVVMKSKPISLGEVVVEKEYIPMRFKTDTIEFNAAAFKTKPDAVVEDLLKKLPGLDIDRAGNIKAMGENVTKVLVDGREFFGSDPKLATRNVPADALKKIQVFDKKSDDAEFTGIDDGLRDKTLNLLLKEDKKNAVFGELLGGAGNKGLYQGSSKVYRFTKENQFAALAMINNINQFGFSFRDYLDFTGSGEGGHGGSVQMRLPSGFAGSFPINFGQPVNGLSTSGAGGLNFSRQFKKDSRYFMSYIANGSDRNLLQSISTRNFTESNSFMQEEVLNQDKLDFSQRFNFGLRNRIDSTQNLYLDGSVSVANGNISSTRNISIFNSESEKNRVSIKPSEKQRRIYGNINGFYNKILNKGKSVFRLASAASWSKNIGNSDWINETMFFDPLRMIYANQLQQNKTFLTNISARSSFTQQFGNSFYLQPGIDAGKQTESLNRLQGPALSLNEKIDSLSPVFISQYTWFKPEIRLIRNTYKTQFTMAMQAELGYTGNSLNNDAQTKNYHFYFVPWLSWEYEYKTARRVRIYYQTEVKVPTINQLLPVADISNPLALSWGNRSLKPQVSNNLSLNWWIFDQFSFTSFLTGINASYTRDKINWDRTIDENMKQTMSLTNVPDDYSIQSNTDFSTPVRRLGIKINSSLEEKWNRGLSYVNGAVNINTNFSQRASLSFENRKKIKLDVKIGGAIQITDAKFSIQESLNNRYVDFSYFTEIRYNPNKHWNFEITTDVTKYNARSFATAISIPLIGVETSYYFLKKNRGILTLKGSDLLNRNKGIERTSELNFLREQRSNMLGRFFMISFKYRLNKFIGSSGRV
jgi:hypothetical protein